MKRFLVPLIFGVAGFAVLVSLGVWQMQRLAWKEGVLAEIEARIGDAPVDLPAVPTVEEHRYLPVAVSGRTTGDDVNVLVSLKEAGAGYRVISAFVTEEGRRILLDEGFIRQAEKTGAFPPVEMRVVGNLHWPDEVDRFTPEPDLAAALWFARDVPALAEVLGTEPILVVARQIDGVAARAAPLPVTTVGIPNNHLGYAVQWFGLAIVWAGMTCFLLWRIRQRME